MSNYKPRIETNNLDLTSILETVEALPDAKPEQTKTATPSLEQQTISPDSGKTLSGVTVEPITSSLLTSLDSDFKAENIAEGVDMFGVSGIYAGGSSELGELGTPTVNTSTGIVTATITKGGVLEEGTSTTLQLSKQAAKTVTPSTSVQTAVAAGKYTTGAVKVAAIPSTYKNFATGTVTATYDDENEISTFTVSGLGFTPTNGVLFLDYTPDGHPNYTVTHIYNTKVRGVGNSELDEDTCTFTKSSGKAVWTYDEYGGYMYVQTGNYRYVIWA